MNRLPYATALISIVVAVGLWLIATWLEGDSAWLKSQPEPAAEISGDSVRPDSPVQADADVAGCDQRGRFAAAGRRIAILFDR